LISGSRAACSVSANRNRIDGETFSKSAGCAFFHTFHAHNRNNKIGNRPLMGQFVSDIKDIRKRARQHMSQGAITDGYKADREQVIKVLNEVLATEIVCTLRYKRHYYMADGFSSESVKQEFLEHAIDEQGHADLVAERITQLGGDPDFNPQTLASRSHAEYVEGTTLRSMVEEDLVAERIAVETYLEIARWLGTDDPTTRRVIENILQKEEEHAEDMSTLLGRLPSE
jgi:bacterioferritin